MITLSAPGGTTAHYALVTVAELKVFMRETGSANDTLLGAILDGVHRATFVETGGRFIVDPGVSFDLLLDGNGTDVLDLPHWPVVSISALSYVQMLGNSTFQVLRTFANTEYQLDADAGRIWLIGGWWPGCVNAIHTTFRAGFSVTPADVKEAVCQWAATRARRAFDSRHDALSAVHNADNISYTRDDIPSSALKTLQRYRYLEKTFA
jgi:hypothetical protein